MAKSKRSKVKMAYKAMRRQALEKKTDEALRKTASKVYGAVGLPMPAERTEAQRMPSRTHNGCVLVTTFVPTPEPVKLNVVHGPLAADAALQKIPVPVIGLPQVGAGSDARMQAEMPKEGREKVERVKFEERPYFYPRRRKTKDAIRKRRPSRHPQNKAAVQF